MAKTGGAAAKLGNQFEDLWSWHAILRLLEGEITAINFEPNIDPVGIEFTCAHLNGHTEYHSVKRRSSSHWTISEISSPKENTGRSILYDLFRKIENNLTATAHFESSAKSSVLDNLPTLFRSHDFLQDCRSQLSKDEDDDYKTICKNLSKTEEDCFALFKRFHHKIISDSLLQNELEKRFPYCLAKKDSSSLNGLELFGVLYSIRNNNLGLSLTKAQILDLLDQNGYVPANWNLRLDIKEKIQLWNMQFKERNQEYGILKEGIRRQESKELFQRIQSGESKVCFLIGTPGIGKSAVLAELVGHLETTTIPFIALRLDQGDAEWERLKNDLKESPEIVLAGLAQGKKAVLILDQLDSISRLSGNFPAAYNHYSMLVKNIRRNFPFISVVIGCRKFDFLHDQSINQISDGNKTDSIELKELEIHTVESTLQKFGIEQLSPKQKDLLRTPLFLRLFLEGDPSYKREYSTPEEIFHLYWHRKQEKLPNGTSLDNCLSKSIDDLLKSGTYLFERALIKERDCLEFLLKENFLTERGTQISFLHPLLQDYAIARKFLKEERILSEHLLKLKPDGLFSFGLKSRAIFSLIWQKDPNRFFLELTNCLSSHKIPLFIKIHILDWYANIGNPTKSDWNFIKKYLSTEHWVFIQPSIIKPFFLKIFQKIKFRVFQFNITKYFSTFFLKEKTTLEIINRIPFGSDAWFELANQQNYWTFPATDSSDDLPLRFAFQIRGTNLSERKLKILIPLMQSWSADVNKHEAIFRIIEFAKIENSENLQNFILNLLKEGFFDSFGGPTKLHSLHYGNIPEKFGITFWAENLKRNLPTKGLRDFFADNSKIMREIFPDSHQFNELLKKEYLFYAETFYPILLEIIERSLKIEERGLLIDEVWRYFTYNTDPHWTSDIFLKNLKKSLISIAETFPNELQRIIGDSYLKRSKTLAYLLFPVFAQNSAKFSSKIYEMILDEPNRLLVGDSGSVGDYIGNYELQGVRTSLRDSWPYFQSLQKSKIQEIILSLNLRKFDSFSMLLLLKEIPEVDLLDICKTKLQELKRRYPNAELDESRTHIMGGYVGSPIPEHALDKMNDRQWIRAMKKYDANYQPKSRDMLKGDGHQLAQALGKKASENPKRFIELLLNTQENLEPFYYGSVLMDISKTWKGSIEISKIFSLIEKAHSLPGHPCIREISHLISNLAEEEIPISILEILNHYAAIGKDPWNEPKKESPDYLHRGLNSDRGSIAWTIGNLLSKDIKHYSMFSKAVENLAVDPSTAVRACASIPVLYMLNLDRDKAVSLFLKMINGRDELLTIHYIDSFFGYACYTHYFTLRDTLLRMVAHSNPRVQAIGAKHISFRSFQDKKAKTDIKKIPWKIEEIRSSIAKLASELISNPKFQTDCKKIFTKLKNDTSKNVRWHLSHAFRDLEDEFFYKEQDWLIEYIRSRSFRDDSHFLLDRLHKLPSVAPKISIALGFSFLQTYLEKREEGYIPIDSLALDLLIRAFNQSTHPNEKKTLLNMIDCSLLWNRRDLLQKMEAKTDPSVA